MESSQGTLLLAYFSLYEDPREPDIKGMTLQLVSKRAIGKSELFTG